MEQVVARELGREGIAAMVAAFYRRVPADELLGPMYPAEDLAGSEERLREFLNFRLLGDPAYSFKRGHPRLRMRHLPFSIGAAERDRWLELMEEAMTEAAISDEGRRVLVPFFAQVLSGVSGRDLPPLIDLARRQPRRAGDAAAVFAAIGQIDALLAQGVEQRAARLDLVGGVAAIGDGDDAGGHSQISLVQSPPG